MRSLITLVFVLMHHCYHVMMDNKFHFKERMFLVCLRFISLVPVIYCWPCFKMYATCFWTNPKEHVVEQTSIVVCMEAVQWNINVSGESFICWTNFHCMEAVQWILHLTVYVHRDRTLILCTRNQILNRVQNWALLLEFGWFSVVLTWAVILVLVGVV